MIILRCFNTIERQLLRWRIRALVAEWTKSKKRLLIYAAGYHTRELLEVTNLTEVDILGISDSNREKHGRVWAGYPVFPPEEIPAIRPDIILISSKDCEDEIYNQLQWVTEKGIQLVRIYRGSGISRLFSVEDIFLHWYESLWSLMYGVRERLRDFLLGPYWNSQHLANQGVLVWEVGFPRFGTSRELTDWLQCQGVQVIEGGHSIYLPPQPSLAGVIPSVTSFYPPNAGFKVLKDFRGPNEARYVTAYASSRILGKWIEPPLEQGATVNYMCGLGIAPRLWDVCAWAGDGALYTVYVIDHVSGIVPSPEECNAFVKHLKELVSTTHLDISLPGWEAQGDFMCPHCNGNLIKSESCRIPQYLDFQYFRCNRKAWAREIIRRANQAFHFGDVWLNVKPVYQSVPGVASISKRDTSRRWMYMTRLLKEANVEVASRLVLDVGCNAGMILYSSLMDGAAWGIGWDRRTVVPYTRDLLFALGASRFTVIGADLHPLYSLEQDIPAELAPLLRESIVFYLSVREHVGILQSLETVPWRALVYEGHQGESIEEAQHVLRSLVSPERRVVTASYVHLRDAVSDARPLLVLVKST